MGLQHGECNAFFVGFNGAAALASREEANDDTFTIGSEFFNQEWRA